MPFGVIVLAILSIILGLFSVLWGALLTGAGGLSWLAGLLSFQETIRVWGGSAFISGILEVMVGVFQIIAGFGLFARRSWAWWVAIIVTAVALIHPIVGVLSGNFWGLFGLIIPGLIFYYLMKQDIKAVFTH